MLRISLLGEQSIVDADSGAVRSRSARTVALAAFLAVHAGAPQPRPRIAGLFWPDSTGAQALTNLRRELHALRHALAEEPCLRVTARDLTWCDTGAVEVDVRVFDGADRAARAAHTAGDDVTAAARAETALAAYRGDLLPGAHDDWVLDARAELQDRAVALCALVGEVHLRCGEPARALDAARLRVRLRPLEEAGHRGLMRLQAAAGDRAAALAAYHRGASVLERELGVEPDPATRALLGRLLATPVTGVLPAGSVATALVGRAPELAAVRGAWRAAAAGRPGTVVVRGGAGVGKTRLLTELAAVVRRSGAVAATARCPASGRLALAPVAEWLRAPELAPAVAGLDRVWRDEVHRLVPPPTPGGRPRPDRPAAAASAPQHHRFSEGLARALLGVGRPTLLVLDDVQWCDAETVAFLGFCLGLAPRAPLLLAVGVRDAASGGAEPAGWTAGLCAAGPLTEIALGPLDGDAAAELAAAVRGAPLAPADRALLFAVTGGFPLHVVEAVRAGLREPALPPGDLAAVLRHRLEQASPAAREIAQLAAAVGREVSLDLLVDAAGRDVDGVVAAVDELWRRRILREQGDGYDFAHDLLRDAAYAQISPPRRWLLHGRVARALDALHAGDPAVAAQLAEQYARAGRPDRAVAEYRRAAGVAAGVFAFTEALRMHDAALAIVRARPPGRARDTDELAILERMAAPLNAWSGYADARLQAVLERSVALAEDLGRRGSLRAGLVALYASRLVQGRLVEAEALARRLLTLAGDGAADVGAARFAAAGVAMFRGRPAESVEHFAVASSLPSTTLGSIGTRADVHGGAWAAHGHWLLGDDAAAAAAAGGAVALARSLDHPYSLVVALAYAALTAQLRGDRPALRRAAAELDTLCTRHGFGYYREWRLVLDGWCRGGADGIALARRGIDRLVADGAHLRMPYWLTLLADLQERAGDPAGARASLDRAEADARARDEVWWLPEVLRCRAAHDDPAPAAVRLRAAAALATAHGSVALLTRCERDLTRVAGGGTAAR